jgi:hypothetical protein
VVKKAAETHLSAKRWAREAQKFDDAQLEQFRKTAELWRNGLSTLTSLLALITVVRGPQLAAELSNGWRLIVLGLVALGFLLLVTGSMLAMNAAFGMPVEDLWLTGENLRKWKQSEVQTGQSRLKGAKFTFVAGVIFIAAATGSAMISQEPAASVVAIDTTEPGIFCGAFVSGDNSGLILAVEDAFGEVTNSRFSYTDIQEIRLLEECPEE